MWGEVLGAVTQQPPDRVERVVSVTTVSDGVLLNPAADLVDDLGT